MVKGTKVCQGDGPFDMVKGTVLLEKTQVKMEYFVNSKVLLPISMTSTKVIDNWGEEKIF